MDIDFFYYQIPEDDINHFLVEGGGSERVVIEGKRGDIFRSRLWRGGRCPVGTDLETTCEGVTCCYKLTSEGYVLIHSFREE